MQEYLCTTTCVSVCVLFLIFVTFNRKTSIRNSSKLFCIRITTTGEFEFDEEVIGEHNDDDNDNHNDDDAVTAYRSM